MPINVKNVSFTYMAGTPMSKKAVDNISLIIEEGEFLGVIGHTGSGKSTFIQQLNGLIKLQEGTIEVFDIVLTNKKRPKPDFRTLRSNVGMVFQYPEYQLFDETVAKDVGFGPRNLKLSVEEIDKRVRRSIELVGLDYESIKDRSPFELSGGQKRRVAIAGVIAMEPKVLILDEPTAGLDPQGRIDILKLIQKLKKECTPTIIMVSHNMDEIASVADRIAVFDKGKIRYHLTPKQLFAHTKDLYKIGLDVPVSVKVRNYLVGKGMELPDEIVCIDELVEAIANNLKISKEDIVDVK